MAVTRRVTFSANSSIGLAKGRDVPFNYENNAHAGGAACDIFAVDTKTGELLSIIPYCWIGAEAAMDFQENDANFNIFIARAKSDARLKVHLKEIGFPTVEEFTFEAWVKFRNINRVRYHLMKALGCTYYSAHNPKEGGENWHFEPGNVLYGPDGNVIHKAATADAHPDSGNPGHTLQKVGPEGVAVYGGRSAHEIARREWGLQDTGSA